MAGKAKVIKSNKRVEVAVVEDNQKLGWKKGQKVSMHPITAESLKKKGLVK